MDREKIINEFKNDFILAFEEEIKLKGYEVPEITADKIESAINEFFGQKTLTDAEKYLYKVFNTFVKDTYGEIDWSMDREAVKETQAYKDWVRHDHIHTVWHYCERTLRASEAWVKANGKAHTAEEAAKIAADKWCEIIFGWHLQDNGALNEDHGGGFPACALATVLAEDSKKNITDEMKTKAHELFQEYYRRLMHYNETADSKDIEWLKENLKDKSGSFDWEYGFSYDLYCDYDPSWALYLILENAGVPENTIRSISPWKTSISIRKEDNMVMYNTYKNVEEL